MKTLQPRKPTPVEPLASGAALNRRLPVGAEVMPTGGVHFRVWAPRSSRVTVQLELARQSFDRAPWRVELEREVHGYSAGLVPEAEAGMLYKYVLDTGAFPDPASRFQPAGPHGPSQIVEPSSYRWSDTDWRGVPREGQIIYEIHVGTFTSEGSWAAACGKLPALADLGVTLLEIMPIADFNGRFGWGYDGVNLFAPTRLYGSPDDFRSFVDQAHRLKLGVILDVVYNHLGPDGNYLKEFSADYFTDRYQNEWGEPLNFDGENCGSVREFFTANARYWIEEFHLDGLRLDATQSMFDASPKHILTEIARAVRSAATGRSTFLVAENEPQNSRLIQPEADGGSGLDAIWNDDFHHSAMVAATGRSEAYYSDYRGAPQEFISAAKRGFLYQGQWYTWQKQRRGTVPAGPHPAQFVVFLQNHDQVANSLCGRRLHDLTSPGLLRALTAVMLLGPSTPMLFQGEEFAATAPFLYFVDHPEELGRVVVAGRRQFLKQFPSLTAPDADLARLVQADERVFERSKLDWSERERHSEVLHLHRDLLQLRREDPVFGQPRPGGVDGAVLHHQAFLLRFFGPGEDRLMIVNLGTNFRLEPMPEPLLAPPAGRNWRLVWSSEASRYGGTGTPLKASEPTWPIPAHAALVFSSLPDREGSHAKADSED